MDWKEQIIRECFERKLPTVLLGSGASISSGFSLKLKPNFPGMPDLAKRYYETVVPDSFGDEDQAAWQQFKGDYESLGAEWWKFNLEAFLTKHPLQNSSQLLKQLLRQTAEALQVPHKALAELFEKDAKIQFPLRTILERLLRSAPTSNPEINVITPNYDLLVEYTADLIKVPCLTGFSGGIIRHWNPDAGFAPPFVRAGNGFKRSKYLRLIKPHGSFAWHQSQADSGLVVEHFALAGPGGDWSRCMIAPGPSKYAEALKDVRRDHMRHMDDAFKNAQSLLVIGYGFNDSHLEEYLKRSLARGTPAIFVTRDATEEARANFVSLYPQVTCITSDSHVGCVVQRGSKREHIPSEPLWELGRFTEEFVH